MQQERALDKHVRLVKAGSKVIHQQGFHRTVLADIAKEANVPPGSIYYYFKTKDELAESVINQRVEHMRGLMQEWDSYVNPKKRLGALIQVWADDREKDSRHGCPIGSLCYELAKTGGQLHHNSAEVLRLLVNWCELQFKAMSKSTAKAREYATHLMCSLQGASLLANAFSDPQVILQETRRLKRWLNKL